MSSAMLFGRLLMTYFLIHHTGCGSSKKGLALLQENGIEPEVRKYMNAGAKLSVDELKDIAKKMGGVSPRAFLREKDAIKFELPESASDAEVFAAMADNPRLIQRPIGIKGDKAVLGRPNEKLLEIA
jgi:arsenate reductase